VKTPDGGQLISGLVDCAATLGLVSEGFVRRFALQTRKSLTKTHVRLANGQRVTSSTVCDVTLKLARHEIRRTFYVLRELRAADMVMGLPWLEDEHAPLQFGTTRVFTLMDGTAVETHIEERRPDCLLMSSSRVQRLMRKTRRNIGRNAEFYVIEVTPATDEPTEFHKGEELTAQQRENFRSLLYDNFQELVQPVDSPLVSRQWDHPIETTGPMKRQRLNILSLTKRAELNRQLKDTAEAGLMRPSYNEFGSPILFVRKVVGSLRLRIDYRGHNEITRTDAYPRPRVDGTLNELKDANFYTRTLPQMLRQWGLHESCCMSQGGRLLQPFSYWARTVNPTERGNTYSAYDLEALAVSEADKHWRCYLEGCFKFLVVIDHDRLRHLLRQPNNKLNKRQARYMRDLQPFLGSMTLAYRKGALSEADPSSRRPDFVPHAAVPLFRDGEVPSHRELRRKSQLLLGDAHFFLMTVNALHMTLEFADLIREGYSQDAFYGDEGEWTKGSRIEARDGYFWRINRLCIPQNSELRLRLIT
jgi:hypothetical protein